MKKSKLQPLRLKCSDSYKRRFLGEDSLISLYPFLFLFLKKKKLLLYSLKSSCRSNEPWSLWPEDEELCMKVLCKLSCKKVQTFIFISMFPWPCDQAQRAHIPAIVQMLSGPDLLFSVKLLIPTNQQSEFSVCKQKNKLYGDLLPSHDIILFMFIAHGTRKHSWLE